jgi:hypothetical protein
VELASARQALKILLSSTSTGGFTEAFFDNVSLTAVALVKTPEPAPGAFVVVGLAACTFVRRRACAANCNIMPA